MQANKSIPELMQELHEKETAGLRKPDPEFVDRLVEAALDSYVCIDAGTTLVTIRGLLPAGAFRPGAAEAIVRKIIEVALEGMAKR